MWYETGFIFCLNTLIRYLYTSHSIWTFAMPVKEK